MLERLLLIAARTVTLANPATAQLRATAQDDVRSRVVHEACRKKAFPTAMGHNGYVLKRMDG